MTEEQHKLWKKDLEELHEVKTENKRLKEIIRIGCHCNRQELIQWLEENNIASDQPFEKEKTIVLRMFVISQALQEKK